MALFWHFLLLGCLAVGGMSTVLPDIYRYVVDEHAMMTARQFADLYALAQAAPGPNVLWVTLVGLQAAGAWGAAATTLGILVPSTSLSLVVSRLHARHAERPLVLAVRRGLAPVALGFMFAAASLLLRSMEQGWAGYAIATATVVVVVGTRISPLWLIAGGAIAGMAGVV